VGKRIYIAGPLSAETPELIDVNVNVAMTAFHALAQEGHYPLCPHVSIFLDRMSISHMSYEDWLSYDFKWLEVSDAVYRMYGVSPGADREVQFAIERGIPVFYDMNQVIEAFQ
jgi:hypothetical protein